MIFQRIQINDGLYKVSKHQCKFLIARERTPFIFSGLTSPTSTPSGLIIDEALMKATKLPSTHFYWICLTGNNNFTHWKPGSSIHLFFTGLPFFRLDTSALIEGWLRRTLLASSLLATRGCSHADGHDPFLSKISSFLKINVLETRRVKYLSDG